jgi:L-ascorbate 6-phosphate lactonase
MIQPVQSGAALLADIESTQLQRGQVAMWWLGQSGYAFKTASALFYIDLYLSEHLTQKYANTDKPHIRMTASPLQASELTHVEWVFATHKHSDHFDPVTLPMLFTASPQAQLVLPFALIDHALSLGLERERLIPTRGEETLRVGSLTVHSVPAAHPDFDYSPENGFPFLSYVFEIDGLTFYHSGDTIRYDGLANRLRPFHPNIVFLPINGTDERRERLKVPPNMNADDAVTLAKEIEAHLLIPHHYDMFTFNTADVQDFETLARAQRYAVLQCGERFIWTA